MRVSWEVSHRSNESLLSHVLMMHERLAQMSELVQENMKRAQQKQKAWYDRNAWNVSFSHPMKCWFCSPQQLTRPVNPFIS